MQSQYIHARTGRTPYTTEQRLTRFWARVDKSAGQDGCWLWLGYKDRYGYGQIRIAGRKQAKASRFAWEIRNGPMAKDQEACHSCDNPACCNPAHIFPGTHAENLHDMKVKGRHWRASQMTCRNGHPFDSFGSRGQRQCSICRRASQQAYEARKKASHGMS